jgi:hypothetical protein
MMNKQEAYGQLHQAGFTGTQIFWLLRLREQYVAQQTKRQECIILRRLEFVRWLVRTGRLTEQTVRQREPAEEHEGFPESMEHPLEQG